MVANSPIHDKTKCTVEFFSLFPGNINLIRPVYSTCICNQRLYDMAYVYLFRFYVIHMYIDRLNCSIDKAFNETYVQAIVNITFGDSSLASPGFDLTTGRGGVTLALSVGAV